MLYLPNMEMKEEKGEEEEEDRGIGHWTSISTYGHPSTAFYFDSFGLPPPIAICNSLLSTNDVVEFADIQFQNDLAVTCGPYICVQALLLARGYSPYQIIHHFQNIQRRGPLELVVYVNLLISLLHHLRDAPVLHPELFPDEKNWKKKA